MSLRTTSFSAHLIPDICAKGGASVRGSQDGRPATVRRRAVGPLGDTSHLRALLLVTCVGDTLPLPDDVFDRTRVLEYPGIQYHMVVWEGFAGFEYS